MMSNDFVKLLKDGMTGELGGTVIFTNRDLATAILLDHAEHLRKVADDPTQLQKMQGFKMPDGSVMSWYDYHLLIADIIEKRCKGL